MVTVGAATPCVDAQTFTIQQQNATFTWSSAASVGAASNVGFSASSCNLDDHLFAWHWCLALPGQGAFPIRDHSHGSYSRSGSADRMTQSIVDLNGLQAFDATVEDRVVATGTDSGYVAHSLTLTNRRSTAQSARVYLYVDADYNGSSFNYTTAESAPNRLIVSSGSSCGGCFEIWADAPDHFQVNAVGQSNSVFSNIQSGSPLPNRGLPFASAANPNDFEGGFEWNVTLAPGASRTLRSVTGHNDLWVDTPARQRNLLSALGGPSGTPTLTATRPTLGQNCFLSIAGCGPAASATLLFGVGRSATLPNCAGLTVGFLTVVAADPIPLTGGAATLRLRGRPCVGLGAGGIPLKFQVFVLDQSSPACLPFLHSDVLELTFGD